MKPLDKRLRQIQDKLRGGEPITIMIMGLGSVGTYLLDYLISQNNPQIRVVAAGRNADKMTTDVNIVRVAALIRQQNASHVAIDGGCDLNHVDAIAACVDRHKPDIIVNASRVYAGLKYGSISWHNLRAYGIWTPLAISYIRHIMEACEMVDTDAMVINTSYSDAVIPWLKAAGRPYPDFGSGNLNHLIPRIRFAAAEMLGVQDFREIEVVIATSHFHDVVISKEGQTEGVDPLLQVRHKGVPVELDVRELYRRCSIPMPTDAKRNMMNASSNFEIIQTVLTSLKDGQTRRFHSPGALGNLGGYPVLIDGASAQARIDDTVFSLEQMAEVNRRSIALDGVEGFEGGALIYTDRLLEKVKAAFGVDLPKRVPFDQIDEVAAFIIREIIIKYKDK